VLLISIAKALVEIAAMSIVAQLLVGLFAPSRRESNPIYRLFDIVTRPVNRTVRRIMPSVVLDQHLPLTSLFVLSVLWLSLLWLKVLYRA
jgi:uncharacterized protein YggT (Ycf19 family)